MLNINPLLLVGGVIGAVTALLIFAYASVKDKKTAMGFERTMADGEILRRLFAYAKPYWAKFLLVLFLMLFSIAYRRAPVAGEQAQKAQQKRQMQSGDCDRVHDAGRTERNIKILHVERGFVAEHERLRKRQHIRREGGLRARFERLGDGFRPVEPAAAPHAGARECFVLYAADEVNALGNVGVRLLPIAQRGRAELHVRRDLIAGAQIGRARVGGIEPRLAVWHVRACEQNGQTAAMLIGSGILRHARRDRLHISRDGLRRRQAHGRSSSIPPEADGRRQQRDHDPAPRLPREQQRHEREHDRRKRTGQHPAHRQEKVRQKNRSRKSACAVCQLSHAVSPSFSGDIINKNGGGNIVVGCR